tara:strand:- start:29140 stop:30330 length:1191 start_codon:yes stop_codon:yes gene_type:complete
MRFIIHLGLGKTGSTSIQHHFRQHFETLQQQGVLYAGLRFETLGKKEAWQRGAGTYTKLSEAELTNQFKHFATQYVAYAESINAHTIVLSNETFSTQLSRLKPFFDWLVANFAVEFSVYVRDIDSWLVSAYEQWGLKDTSKSRNVMTFEEFAKSGRHRIAGDCLNQLASFGYLAQTHVKNMHHAKNKDVTEDFFSTFNLPLIAPPQKTNEATNKRQRAFFYLSNLHRKKKLKVSSTLRKEQALHRSGHHHQKFVTQCRPTQDALIEESILKEKRRVNRFLPADEKLPDNVKFKAVDNNIDAFTFNLMDSHIKYEHLLGELDSELLIESASKLEYIDLNLSLKLLKLARTKRPNGKVINDKIKAYEALLADGHKAKEQKGRLKKILSAALGNLRKRA